MSTRSIIVLKLLWRGAAALTLAAWAFPSASQAESAASLAAQGKASYDADKLDESIAAYKQALALNPESPVLQYNFGTALARKGKVNDALKVLHQAAQNPNFPAKSDAMFNLGTTMAGSALQSAAAGQARSANGSLSPQSGAVAPTDIDQQMKSLEGAMTALRESILSDANPATNKEAKYNYEVTMAKLDELKKKQLEQQKKDQGGQGKPQQNQKDQQDKNQKQDQQQQNSQQKNGQSQNGQQQNANPNGQPTPEPTPGADGHGQQAQGAPTPTPSPAAGNPPDPQQKDKQQAQQSKGLEGQASPTPAPSATPNAGQAMESPKDGKNEGKQEGPAAAAAAAQAQQTPTPDQLNSMRLLNLLEKEKPEQFKKLYQFQGQADTPPQKDW